MKRLLVVVCLVVAGIGGMQSTGAAQAAGNSDAAQACQQGGYLSLVSSDGSSFANVGECVSYAAQGGALQTAGSGGSSCVVGTYSGCVTLSNVSLPYPSNSSLGTLTLSGSYSFSPLTDCVGDPVSVCGPSTGGGTYTVTGGSFNGGTGGTFTVDDAFYTWYSSGLCSSSTGQEHVVQVTFTDGSNTTTTYMDVQFSSGGPTLTLLDTSLATLYQTAGGMATGASLTC